MAKKSIHQYLIHYGLLVESRYLGARRISGFQMGPMHDFEIRVLPHVGRDPQVKDRLCLIDRNFKKIEDRTTDVTSVYVPELAGRMDAVQLANGDYERWLDLVLVGFGVNVEDTPEHRKLWADTFAENTRNLQNLTAILGSPERARSFVTDILNS